MFAALRKAFTPLSWNQDDLTHRCIFGRSSETPPYDQEDPRYDEYLQELEKRNNLADRIMKNRGLDGYYDPSGQNDELTRLKAINAQLAAVVSAQNYFTDEPYFHVRTASSSTGPSVV